MTKSLFLEREGVKLHYRMMGQGKPLILLNPAFSDMRIWSWVAEALSRKYQVVQFDYRYSGKTEQDGSDYSLFGDLNLLIEALDLSHVNLIGLSAGSHTALEYTILYPEKVDKLFLMSTGLFGVKEDERKVKSMADFQRALHSGNMKGAASIWTDMWLVGQKRPNQNMSDNQRDLFHTITQETLMKSGNFKMPRLINPPVNARLNQIEQEVYHLLGTFDYEDVKNASQTLSEQIKNYSEEVVQTAHIQPLEAPILVIDRIMTFID